MKTAVSKLISNLNLKESDYYSMVNFGISEYDNNIDNLARPAKDKSGDPIVWRKFKSMSNIFNLESWEEMIDRRGFSLMTGAKAYTLKSVSSPNEQIVANKTYLVMVTDDHYNGNDDQNKEFDQMRETTMSKKEFLNQCYNVAGNFNFRYNKAVMIDPYYEEGALQAFLYEVVPALSVSLNSIVDYPANMGIERVNGGYRMSFDFKSISDRYILKRLVLTVIGKNNSFFQSYQYDGDGRVDIILPMLQFEDFVKIKMSAWLLQNDSVYNGALLSPHDNNFSRLNVSLSHKLKNEVYFFGLIPIPDWMWFFTDDWHVAVIMWDLMALLVVVTIMWFFMRWLIRINTTYQPKNDKITIKRIK